MSKPYRSQRVLWEQFRGPSASAIRRDLPPEGIRGLTQPWASAADPQADDGALSRVRIAFPLVVGVVVALGGCTLLLRATDEKDHAYELLALTLSGLLLIVTAIGVWGCIRLQTRMLQQRLSERPDSLLPAIMELDDAPRAMSIYLGNDYPWYYSWFGLKRDDIVWCAGDPQSQCLLIEGVRYRYLIPAHSIRALEPYKTGGTIVLHLRFEAAGETLGMMLAMVNLNLTPKGELPEDHAAGECDRLRMGTGLPPGAATPAFPKLDDPDDPTQAPTRQVGFDKRG